VVSALGAGGMGEVYKARDTRLDRTVAIKILQTALADDADARARFEREARAIAALDHPHICSVYDIGQHDGLHYLVMQYQDGETLAARLARTKGPLPVDHVLMIAIALADALDKTHRAGITHRDLKPGNVMLTKAGAKLLDFGLAKLRGPVSPISMSGMTRLATTIPDTARGTILGTVQYMAPEQVEGRQADARSDIWAFGAVLYEMATGQRPFDGDSPASVIGAILRDHPPSISTRQPLAPRALDDLVERCLVKDPEDRWQSIGDVKHQLAAIAQTSSADVRGDTVRTRRSPRVSRWLAIAGALALSGVVAAVATWLAIRSTAVSSASPSFVRLALDLGREVSFTAFTTVAALSPDGTRIVFVSSGTDGIARLLVRRLDHSESMALAGTEGAYNPFFSPDGLSVGFFAGGKLKTTRLDGSAPIVLCDAPAGRGASWSEDGRIVAALDTRAGLSIVSSTGAVTSLTELAAGEISHRYPRVLPGGKGVLFTVASVPSNYTAASIAAAPLDTNASSKSRKIVLANVGMSPHYVPTGHLIYVADGKLNAVPFDVDRLETRGTAVPVLDDVSASAQLGDAQIDFSDTGTLLYRSGQTSAKTIIQWLKGDGKTEALWEEPAYYSYPRLSPDGSRLAYVVGEGPNTVIWVYDAQRGGKTRLTAGPGVNLFPLWSPDGQFVVFQSAGELYWTRSDGAQPPQPLSTSARRGFPTSFTPDGKSLLYYELKPSGGSLIQSLSVENQSGTLRAGEPKLFRELSSGNSSAAVSPDGRWVAYASSESGTYQVYVRAFPDAGNQKLISTGGGAFPVWSRAGNQLFYRTEDQVLMVVDYTVAAGSFVAGKPRVWSDKRLFNVGLAQNFDLAPDGQRFAVLMTAEDAERSATEQTMLVVNFFDELRRRVAAGQKQ